MVNQLNTITKMTQCFTQLEKDDTSTELEEPEDVEKLTGVTSLNLMGASGNAIATVRDISNTEGENYYFYNKDMRESTTNLLNVEGKSEVSYEYTDFGETEINGDENFYNEICYTGGIYDKIGRASCRERV